MRYFILLLVGIISIECVWRYDDMGNLQGNLKRTLTNIIRR